ncbi:hypothetical protein QBC37DRAFT_434300 [Rhypophila decipiens]|uniref:Uncharacterized protein n=1 Tax=Rhypophila decipiens TaxID=261697 RepID=A0AAN7AZ72_9PEZI|nr:hypothetical protein QBC37DRAFT_434300 [Rhypophila decipiens]
MVNITAVAIAVLATVAPALVAADNCNPAFNYCGKTLLGMGNYRPQIVEALKAAGKADTEWNITNTLFDCLPDNNKGNIRVLRVCSVYCSDQGKGVSDKCYNTA